MKLKSETGELVDVASYETDMEKLVENFNQWADDLIVSIQELPPEFASSQEAKITMVNWAKVNLRRLAKEIKG